MDRPSLILTRASGRRQTDASLSGSLKDTSADGS
jgi:hypothetical protein